MACSITASNGEGNGEIVDGFGFMLNNVLGESDVNPHGDGWPTDTRLSSMMCPTIIEHGDGAVTALGTGGSSRIRSAISQVVAALCCAEQDLDRAIGAPRIHVADGHLDVEPGHQHNAVEAMLAAFPDHRIWPRPDLYFGGVHAAQRRLDGSLVGVGDARRGGAGIIALEPS
jgi:gamma-glutamyltranspeptidase/glutathione hydrolase